MVFRFLLIHKKCFELYIIFHKQCMAYNFDSSLQWLYKDIMWLLIITISMDWVTHWTLWNENKAWKIIPSYFFENIWKPNFLRSSVTMKCNFRSYKITNSLSANICGFLDLARLSWCDNEQDFIILLKGTLLEGDTIFCNQCCLTCFGKL